MKEKHMIIAALAALTAAFVGCTSTTIEWGGQNAVRDADGHVLTDPSGKPYYEKPQNYYHQNKHWTDEKVQDLRVAANADGSYEATLGHYDSVVNASNLVALVREGLSGSAELAGRIGAAIATSGGSVAAEGGAGAIVALAKQAYSSFKSGGGDESKAVVSTSANGTVSVSDGKVCTTCTDGSCTTGSCSD